MTVNRIAICFHEQVSTCFSVRLSQFYPVFTP